MSRNNSRRQPFDPLAHATVGAGPTGQAPDGQSDQQQPNQDDASIDAAYELTATGDDDVETFEGVMVMIPTAIVPPGYSRSRVELISLTEPQARALQQLTAGLRARNARCQKRTARTSDGVVVDTESDALRWFLDQVSVAASVAAKSLPIGASHHDNSE